MKNIHCFKNLSLINHYKYNSFCFLVLFYTFILNQLIFFPLFKIDCCSIIQFNLIFLLSHENNHDDLAFWLKCIDHNLYTSLNDWHISINDPILLLLTLAFYCNQEDILLLILSMALYELLDSYILPSSLTLFSSNNFHYCI